MYMLILNNDCHYRIFKKSKFSVVMDAGFEQDGWTRFFKLLSYLLTLLFLNQF